MEVTNVRRDGNNSTELQNSQSIKAAGKLSLNATYVNGKETTGLEHVSQQKWNYPRINMWRTFATFLGFFIMGLNDGAYGALIPYLEAYYHVSYTIISLVFLSPFVGYLVSAFVVNQIHMTFGQRGIAILGPGVRLIAYIVISQHPPYPVLVIFFILAAFGVGLEDGAWNAWLGNMENANETLGFLHGCYGLGATLSPLMATSMITKAHLQWYIFYYIMIGIAAVEMVSCVCAFWTASGKQFRDDHPRTSDQSGGRVREALSNRITWICAFFLLAYTGIEVAIGGWIVVFTMNVRHATPFAAGMSETAFWLGCTLGRVSLGFVTPRIGEKLAILIYFALATAFHLVLYLAPSLPLSFAAVALEGFFLGPMFPAAVVAATKLLPAHLHVGGVGFAAAFAATGACVLPFAVGAITAKKGVKVLMPIVLAALVVDAGVWALLPAMGRRKWRGNRNQKGRGEGEREISCLQDRL